jgi:hypothetical protein
MPSSHENKTTSRRRFLANTSAAISATSLLQGSDWCRIYATEATSSPTAETLAGELHASLTADQRKQVCFPWNYQHPKYGLLRTRVANNWQASEPEIASDFFTTTQQSMIRKIFEGIISPKWQPQFDKQLEDDCGGFGYSQSVALLGEPGSGNFQFLLSGRHMTLRCDGDSADHVAFGGPIFYGHDTGNFHEEPTHPGNVFWPQAVAANKVYELLDRHQQEASIVRRSPKESAIQFHGKTDRPGLSVADLTDEQKKELGNVLKLLLEPFRPSDQAEIDHCLASQGGIDACRLVYYKDKDLGNDGVWDNWRLEGPAFVWHFRGAPHVHVWVNIADSPQVPTNA